MNLEPSICASESLVVALFVLCFGASLGSGEVIEEAVGKTSEVILEWPPIADGYAPVRWPRTRKI